MTDRLNAHDPPRERTDAPRERTDSPRERTDPPGERTPDATPDGEERFAFLARAGRILAHSIDYERTLETVASLALPYLGAWCIVDVVEEGHLRRVAVIHPDPERQELAREVCDRYPRQTAESLGVYRVLETGEPEVVMPADGKPVSSHAADAEHGRLLRELGVTGYMTVPMPARGEIHGTMTFVVREDGRRIGEPDVLLAEDLAHRAGLAVDNSRLFRKSQEANRAKADFLAVISHELRTPLTAILGFADLLSAGVDGPVNEAQQGRLERIQRSTNHMVQLVDELLAYAQVEARTGTVEASDVSVREVVERALDPVREEAASKRLELAVDVDVEEPFRTDPRMVRQLLVNLLTNAVKYTEEGRVVVRARLQDGALDLEVEDTGSGIAEEHQSKIFEAFWQAENPNTRTYGGTGIGLSLTRRLVDALGGEIELESAFGEGSCFSVRLPPVRESRDPA